METLNYDVLAKSGYNGYILKNAPEKVLQFGEGNFLRAFVDYWFDLANEKADWNGKCVLVQPIAPGLAKMINEQEVCTPSTCAAVKTARRSMTSASFPVFPAA